jgi:predicted metalloprotease with PDZ domain
VNRFVPLTAIVALAAQCISAQEQPGVSAAFEARYTVSLTNPAKHLLTVKIELPPGPDQRDLQLPAWYALYQVRDFSQYLTGVHGTSSAVSIRKLNSSRWRIGGARNGAEIEYEVFADDPGPFGAELNSQHAFFNLAEVLMYPTDAQGPLQIRFANLPSGWLIAAALPTIANGFTARNYDELVDSPVEIGKFEESDFEEGGGHYRVIVDAVPGDYDMSDIVSTLRSIVEAETSWMDDRPFSTYVFFYHFPRDWRGAGGMEHANGTAIGINSQALARNPQALAEISAHEFFHLWNVKRIRPKSLEPIDYARENYTDALWFSEGVTSTVENYALLRTGLLEEQNYFERLGRAITELEQRPAHLTQSAEESSIDTWLEKYPNYNSPERSISYYNKGELLGVMLDLKLRDATGGAKSLRDLFQWMNANYAKKGLYFEDSEGVRRATETISHADLKSFFDKYVSGTVEIPWNEYFNTVGLQLVTQKVEVADPGFVATRNFDSPLTVASVQENGRAKKAGLAEGDIVLKVNGEIAGQNLEQTLAGLHPGDKLKIRVQNRDGEREMSWKLDGREETQFQLQDLPAITPEQGTRRAAWLKGESEAAKECQFVVPDGNVGLVDGHPHCWNKSEDDRFG